MPALPDSADAEVEEWYDPDGRVCGYGYTLNGQHWIHVPDLASFRFDGSRDEVTAIAAPSARPEWIFEAYQRSVLPVVLQALGREVLHASAFLTPHGVVALCAYSGTGKSTTAYAFGRRGYRIWADDALAFAATARSVGAIPLPFESYLRPDAASFFNRERTPARTTAGWDSTPADGLKSTPLAAVCVLERIPGVDDQGTVVISRLSTSQAFLAVLAHAYCFSLKDSERKRQMLQQYLALTAQVPVFAVRFRPGWDRLPAVLDGIERAVIGG